MSGRRWPIGARRERRAKSRTKRSAPPLPCACGHPHEMHLHLRHGADCGACGRDQCPRYVPSTGVLELDAPDVDLPLPRDAETSEHGTAAQP